MSYGQVITEYFVYFESLDLINATLVKGNFKFNYLDPFPNDPKHSTSLLLGKISELVIINGCKDQNRNREYAKIARIGKKKNKELDKFKPIIATDLDEKILNKNDNQIDVFWLKENTSNELLLQISKSNNSGKYAGLQVKFSTDGVNYILPYLKQSKYVVPIVYFGYENDYEKIRDKYYSFLEKNTNKKKREISSFIDGYFINMRSFDRDAYEKVINFYPLVEKLIKGKFKIDDLLDTKKIFRESLIDHALKNSKIRNEIILTSSN